MPDFVSHISEALKYDRFLDKRGTYIQSIRYFCVDTHRTLRHRLIEINLDYLRLFGSCGYACEPWADPAGIRPELILPGFARATLGK